MTEAYYCQIHGTKFDAYDGEEAVCPNCESEWYPCEEYPEMCDEAPMD